MSKEIDTKENNGKYVQLTREVEQDSNLLGEEGVKILKNLRRKYPDIDLSAYKVKVKDNE